MEVTRKSRLLIRAQNIAFVVLFLVAIGLLGWLSTRYVYESDWTAGGRNTLSEASVQLLAAIEGPVEISAFVREHELLRKRIEALVARYQREKPDLAFAFVNPDTAPARVRELGITEGELLIEYRGRTERLLDLSEQGLTNALQRVLRHETRFIGFLEGHGERSPHGQANHDLGDFVQELERRGLSARGLNLARTPAIPENISMLVIAGPRVPLLQGEVAIVREYLAGGGHLLWLGDPGELHGLEPIAQKLGIEQVPGVVVDPSTQLFGIRDPAMVLVADYRRAHAITRGFETVTLFPWAAALEVDAPDGWEAVPLLTTLPRSWAAAGDLLGEIHFDPTRDRAGPLHIGYALTRSVEGEDGEVREQRIVVTGDGDFLSNAFLGNGGNLDLGLNMINWLAHDDRLLAIPAKTAPDLELNLSSSASVAIAAGFLLVLPLGLLGTGVTIWWRRRRR
jgi:ABC-type uncharacterized transport system involved in gliding motility auxiliary subunit